MTGTEHLDKTRIPNTETTDTGIPGVTIRFAHEDDIQAILGFINELAEYEHMVDQVAATEEILLDSLFARHAAEAILAEDMGVPVGFAVIYNTFSTWTGKPGIYLEDLYVSPAARGKRIGTALLAYLAHLTIERDCARLEWACLDWNEPSLKFYASVGAKQMSDWIVHRVDDESLTALAKRFESFEL